MNQNALRERAKLLHDEYGVAYAFIARKVGVTNSYLCQWMKGKEFTDGNAEKLADFIYSIKLKGE